MGRLQDQIIATLEQSYARGMAEGIFKPLDADIVRTAIFGVCFLLTMLARDKGPAASASIVRGADTVGKRWPLSQRPSDHR